MSAPPTTPGEARLESASEATLVPTIDFRDSTAQRVVDAGAQHGRSGSFVGTGFHMHTEFLHQRFGLHHHIQQMRNRCALVAADIGHARLQQGLGHRQYAFTVKGLTLT